MGLDFLVRNTAACPEYYHVVTYADTVLALGHNFLL